jgi:putative sigma-54 modulation protein
MEIKIQAIHFEATEKLEQFIDKKLSKLAKFNEEIGRIEVSLKVVKPETALNKEVALKAVLPGAELFAQETCNTFEEAIDKTVESLLRQATKYKEKQKNR